MNSITSGASPTLQDADRHFEITTMDQLTSPTIHVSSDAGVQAREAKMKSIWADLA